MARIGAMAIKVSIVGVGKSKMGLKLLGFVARVFKISLRIKYGDANND